MSKQDIEKRLGFAAQGVKAEMAIGSYKQGDRTVTVNGKKYEVLPYQMDFFIKELATLDTPEWRADVVKEYLRRGYIKATAARPGVKATFAEFNVGDKVVATPNNHIDAYGRIIKIENGIATIASAEGNVKAKLSDLELVKKGSVEDLRRLGMKGFARPGVKAKMASGWSGKTAKLNRYGDFAVVAAGEDGYAKGFANRTQAQAFSDKHNLGGVKFPSSGGRSFYVYVEAPKASESTTAARAGAKTEFAADKRTTAGALRKALKAKGITSAADLEWHGISAKDPDSTPYWLYEDGSMEKIKSSRPGVKAKFAKPQFRTKKLHNGYIAVEVNQGSGWERYDTTHEESWNGIEEYERGYQKAYDRGLRYSGGAWRIPSTTASRPGAKAKA